MTNREIDALVAEKVMGYVREINTSLGVDLDGWRTGENSWTSSFSPSTDISDAWKVFEHFIKAEVEKWDKKFYVAYIRIIENLNGDVQSFSAYAETAPMAICLAALKAVGVEVNGK